MTHPQIAAFARLAKESVPPTRVLAGQKTLLSRGLHDIRYDAVHDEIVVTNPYAQAILTFRGNANGEEAPIRIIQGSRTQLWSNLDRVDVDPVHNEIFLPVRDAILVFSREAQGDVSPIRIIKGPDTRLTRVGSFSAGAIAVDPLHDLIVVGTNSGSTSGTRQDAGGLLLFNRTDHGNVKPRAVIHGPKTGIIRTNQISLYPPQGWIVVAQQGRAYPGVAEPEGAFVGIWSIHDQGDVPPRWKIAGPKSLLKRPRGVVLDPQNKELIVADMRLNALLTFSLPEIF